MRVVRYASGSTPAPPTRRLIILLYLFDNMIYPVIRGVYYNPCCHVCYVILYRNTPTTAPTPPTLQHHYCMIHIILLNLTLAEGMVCRP